MDLEIESLLFKQVEKPKHHLMTKIINVWENRYRINVYTETFDTTIQLTKRKIYASYFCHYSPGNLEIKDLSNGSRTTKPTF
jgi:hypothetical protein